LCAALLASQAAKAFTCLRVGCPGLLPGAGACEPPQAASRTAPARAAMTMAAGRDPRTRRMLFFVI
jgi:hypothetical protein